MRLLAVLLILKGPAVQAPEAGKKGNAKSGKAGGKESGKEGKSKPAQDFAANAAATSVAMPDHAMFNPAAADSAPSKCLSLVTLAVSSSLAQAAQQA